nr:hypothetical protein [uncultured Fluviicola sp.]
MKEQKLVELLKKVNEEVHKLEQEGFTVEISYMSGKGFLAVNPKTELRIYKPIIIEKTSS